MRKVTLGLIISMMIISTATLASLNQFAGTWKNIDSNTSGVTTLDIRVTGVNITVQAWGKCTPTDCDWGRVNAYPYAPNVSSDLAKTALALSAVFTTSFSEKIMIVRPVGTNRLQAEVLTRFTDNSGRSNYRSIYTFKFSPPIIIPEDCLSYNPANLRIVNEGASGWLLTDGVSRMLTLDNKSDAKNALALTKRHTSHCFIGRNNKRPNRSDYIVEYWIGNSGITTTISSEDCISYNPANLRIVNEGASGWLLTDGSSRMLMLDNEQDAQNALILAKQYTKQCFIGRGNSRPNRKDYIVQYWK